MLEFEKMQRQYTWQRVIVGVSILAVSGMNGVWGNHALVRTDSTVVGAIRPEVETAVEVVREKLTIGLETSEGVRGGGLGRNALVVRVRADYQMKNPTGVAQSLALAFPLFQPERGRWAAEAKDAAAVSGFLVTQDGTPLAVSAERPSAGKPENDDERQRQWARRLDAWVAERPDVAELAKGVKIGNIDAEYNTAYQMLHEVVEKSGIDAAIRYDVLEVVLAERPAEAFEHVCRLMPWVDEQFAVMDTQGKPVSVLQENARVYESHREEWGKRVTEWLKKYPRVDAAAEPARVAKKRSEARIQREKTLEELLAKKYGLSAEASVGVAASYEMRTAGDAAEPTKEWAGPAVMTDGFAVRRMPVYVRAAVARALWPDAAKELDAERTAQAELIAAWGEDHRFLSPLTGKLYRREGSSRVKDPEAAWWVEKDQELGMEQYSQEATLQDHLPVLMKYAATLPAGAETTVTVEYTTGTDLDQALYMGMTYAAVAQFTYDLETVKYWKSFGPIDVTVTAPAAFHLVVRAGEEMGLEKVRIVEGRQEVSGTIRKATGNLHLAAVPTGPDRSIEPLWDMYAKDPATLDRLRGLLAETKDRQQRAVIRAAEVKALSRAGQRVDAWQERMTGIEESPAAAAVIDTGFDSYGPERAQAEEVWNYVEAKAKSPAIALGPALEYDVAKNELRRFMGGSDRALTTGDLAALARRVETWDVLKGSPDEALGMHFILCMAGAAHRDAHLTALVELGMQREELAEKALRMVALLKGDNGGGWPLIAKYMPASFATGGSARDYAARDVLIAIHGRPNDVLALARRTTDDHTLIAAVKALERMSVPAESREGVIGLEDKLAKFDSEYTEYLKMVADWGEPGRAALRSWMGKRPTWAMRLGAILAEHGDMSAVEQAVVAYNTMKAPADVWAVERRELSKAVEILSRSQEPAVWERLKYRTDLPDYENERLLVSLREHPVPEAWALVEGYYEQHARGKKDLQAGWLVDVAVKIGGKKALPMVKELAGHGNMAYECARAIGELE